MKPPLHIHLVIHSTFYYGIMLIWNTDKNFFNFKIFIYKDI